MDTLYRLLPPLVIPISELLCFLCNVVYLLIHNNIFDDLYIHTYTHVLKQYVMSNTMQCCILGLYYIFYINGQKTTFDLSWPLYQCGGLCEIFLSFKLVSQKKSPWDTKIRMIVSYQFHSLNNWKHAFRRLSEKTETILIFSLKQSTSKKWMICRWLLKAVWFIDLFYRL